MSVAETLRPLPSALPLLVQPRLARTFIVANIAGIIAISLAMRIWQLGHVPGINGDEAWYGIQAMRLLHNELVAWRTPTNNILNPLYFLPLAGLHVLFAPSPELLRWPAVMSGVLALVLNYTLCRRTFDDRTAALTTTLLAILPVNIAYSRFGWDTSQTLMATLPAVYLPLMAIREPQHRQRWLLLAAVAFLASLLVHPTNIFTATLIIVPVLWTSRTELLDRLRRLRSWQWIGLAVIVLPAAGALIWLARHWVESMCARATSISQWWEFACHYQRLFSGITVYRYLAGSTLPTQHQVHDWHPLDLAWGLLVWVAAMGICGRVRSRHANPLDASLVVGWAVMLAGFFLVAGPGAIAPHYERYGLCLIAPGVLLVWRGVSWWLEECRSRVIPVTALLAFGWLTLLGFREHYFEHVHDTGGTSHETFRTAALEPKQAVLSHILSQRNADQLSWIVTSEYWNEKPLTYLATAYDQLRVENWSHVRGSVELQAAMRDGRVWFVEFAGSRACQELRAWLDGQGVQCQETAINDYAGQPVLVLLKPRPVTGHDVVRCARD